MYPPKTRANVGMLQCISEGHGKPPVYMSDSTIVLCDIYTVAIVQLFLEKQGMESDTPKHYPYNDQGAFIPTLLSVLDC